MQSSYIHSMNDSMNVNGYQEEIEQENNLQFLTSDGAFHVPFHAPSENGSLTHLASHGSESIPSHASTQSQLSAYSVVNTNQPPYSYQPLQFSNAPVTVPYSTLGQVLTNNSEQTAFPNLLNSFLRYQNHASTEPTSSSIASTSESAYDFRSTRNSKFVRVAKRQELKQNKLRGDGNKLLSTRATYVLEGWYEANTDWPYPSKAEKQVMASAGGITIEQVNSWFANRRNRSQNTRPKKNMVKLAQAITGLCEEYQDMSHGIISAAEMKSRILALINYHLQKKHQVVEMDWDTNGQMLAVIDDQTQKYPILGVHTRRISQTSWSAAGLLATIGEDNILALSSVDGDLIKQIRLEGIPSDVRFIHTMLSKYGQNEDNSISCILDNNQLLLWNFHEDAPPMTFTFDDSCGDIVSYEWKSAENIVVGFSSGNLALISMTEVNIGQEVFRIREYDDEFLSLAMSAKLKRLATATDRCVKIHELDNLHEVVTKIEVDDVGMEGQGSFHHDRTTCAIGWSDDGQLMGIISSRNILHVFLSQLSLMTSVSANGIVARFSSLREITVEPLHIDPKNYPLNSRVIQICADPTFIGIGPDHLAIGTDNKVYFYGYRNSEDPKIVNEFTNSGTVRAIKLNSEYAAFATTDGRIILQWIEANTFPVKTKCLKSDRDEYSKILDQGKIKARSQAHQFALREHKIIPENGELITDFDITDHLLIYSTESGKLCQFFIDEWDIVNTYEHFCSINTISSTKSGLILGFTDAHRSAYIFNSISSTLVEIPSLPEGVKQLLWNFDECENPLLMAITKETLFVYRYFMSCIQNFDDDATQDTEISKTLALNSNRSANDRSTDNALSSHRNSLLARRSTCTLIAKCCRISDGECRLIDQMNVPPNHTPLGSFGEDVCFLSQNGRLVHVSLLSYAFRSVTKQFVGSRHQDSLNVGIERALEANRAPCVRTTGLQAERNKLTNDDLAEHFENALNVGAFEDALVLADFLQQPARWRQLAKICVSSLEFDLAIEAFRRVNDSGGVLAVQKMMEIEEKQLLYGHVFMFLGDFNRAQEFLLASSKPEAALEMRRDLLHWDTALQLAHSLKPSEVPFIGREYAFELECIGDYVNALMHYERALERPALSTTNENHNDLVEEAADYLVIGSCSGSGDYQFDEWNDHADICNSGIIRNIIRLGDYKRGVALALKSSNRALKMVCATILEQAKQWSEAAALLEDVGQTDSAIEIYLKSKNYDKAGELLRTTKAPCELYLEYAKTREVSGAYSEAVMAYERANDWESVVRLLLEKMNNSAEAARVAKESKNMEAAKVVAVYFTKIGDFASAIQFLVLAKCHNAAYELAFKHRKMEVYANVIAPYLNKCISLVNEFLQGKDASPEEYKSLAIHFERERNCLLTGKFFLYAKQYAKAVRYLLRVPYAENVSSNSNSTSSAASATAIELAIEAVSTARDNKLTHMLLTYLLGEADGVAKDPRYLFRLYMALDQHREAARTAIIVAREEQAAGNYRHARDLLFSMVVELRRRHIKMPVEMLDILGLLHSYLLVKLHIKLGNHMTAARLLIRIAQNVSKFPSHIVPILSGAVIECHKVGLKHTSFTYASILLRAEYREKIDTRYRRRFEGLVRRPERLLPDEAAILGSTSTCPFCPDSAVPEYELICGSCRMNLPYCALTGKHIVREDMTVCPCCDFPMTYSTLLTFLEKYPDLTCPMCSSPLVRDEIHHLVDAVEVLCNWNSGSIEPENTDDTYAPTSVREASCQKDRTLDQVPSSENNASIQ
ncbi:hypothetical protein Aperf_G00000068279 [Anoplocephala perfoliata]